VDPTVGALLAVVVVVVAAGRSSGLERAALGSRCRHYGTPAAREVELGSWPMQLQRLGIVRARCLLRRDVGTQVVTATVVVDSSVPPPILAKLRDPTERVLLCAWLKGPHVVVVVAAERSSGAGAGAGAIPPLVTLLGSAYPADVREIAAGGGAEEPFKESWLCSHYR
jgi:hypothetical protein